MQSSAVITESAHSQETVKNGVFSKSTRFAGDKSDYIHKINRSIRTTLSEQKIITRRKPVYVFFGKKLQSEIPMNSIMACLAQGRKTGRNLLTGGIRY